jgi:hypothetical protein
MLLFPPFYTLYYYFFSYSFQDVFLNPLHFLRETCHNEKTIMLSIPENNLELGRPPRLCYPLVILLTRRDPCNLHPNEPVSTSVYLVAGATS